MAHFALIDGNNIVITVVVAERDFIKSGALGDPSEWIEDTDDIWNTPAVGDKWDPINKAFIGPKLYPSHILNDQYQWVTPVPRPEKEGIFRWNEDIINWEEVFLD